MYKNQHGAIIDRQCVSSYIIIKFIKTECQSSIYFKIDFMFSGYINLYVMSPAYAIYKILRTVNMSESEFEDKSFQSLFSYYKEVLDKFYGISGIRNLIKRGAEKGIEVKYKHRFISSRINYRQATALIVDDYIESLYQIHPEYNQIHLLSLKKGTRSELILISTRDKRKGKYPLNLNESQNLDYYLNRVEEHISKVKILIETSIGQKEGENINE